MATVYLLGVALLAITVSAQSRDHSGQWTTWSAWTPCSVSCDQGARSRYRGCVERTPRGLKRLATDRCPGRHRQFELCEIMPCPPNSQTPREYQCAEHNRDVINNRTYDWLPFQTGHSSCDLGCLAAGYAFYNHFGHVTDGMPCGEKEARRHGNNRHPGNEHQRRVCVDGQCEAVGCDNIVGSGTRYDHCKVCGGDNVNCHRYRNSFLILDPPQSVSQQYQELVRIPEGATNVEVTDHSPNYLAMSDGAGTYILNGNWLIDWPGDFDVAGTRVNYDRNGNTEILGISGPTTRNFTISLLFKERNPGVHFEFYVPTSKLDQIVIPDTKKASTRYIPPAYLPPKYGNVQVPPGPDPRDSPHTTRVTKRPVLPVDHNSRKSGMEIPLARPLGADPVESEELVGDANPHQAELELLESLGYLPGSSHLAAYKSNEFDELNGIPLSGGQNSANLGGIPLSKPADSSNSANLWNNNYDYALYGPYPPPTDPGHQLPPQGLFDPLEETEFDWDTFYQNQNVPVPGYPNSANGQYLGNQLYPAGVSTYGVDQGRPKDPNFPASVPHLSNHRLQQAGLTRPDHTSSHTGDHNANPSNVLRQDQNSYVANRRPNKQNAAVHINQRDASQNVQENLRQLPVARSNQHMSQTPSNTKTTEVFESSSSSSSGSNKSSSSDRRRSSSRSGGSSSSSSRQTSSGQLNRRTPPPNTNSGSHDKRHRSSRRQHDPNNKPLHPTDYIITNRRQYYLDYYKRQAASGQPGPFLPYDLDYPYSYSDPNYQEGVPEEAANQVKSHTPSHSILNTDEDEDDIHVVDWTYLAFDDDEDHAVGSFKTTDDSSSSSSSKSVEDTSALQEATPLPGSTNPAAPGSIPDLDFLSPDFEGFGDDEVFDYINTILGQLVPANEATSQAITPRLTTSSPTTERPLTTTTTTTSSRPVREKRTCPRCPKTKKTIDESLCESDVVVRVSTVKSKVFGNETRYKFRNLETFKGPQDGLDYLWTDNPCRCPRLKPAKDYLVSAEVRGSKTYITQGSLIRGYRVNLANKIPQLLKRCS